MKVDLTFHKLLLTLSPTKIQKEFGVCRPTVNHWKACPQKIKVADFGHLCEYLELTPEEIGQAVIEVTHFYD